jgi:geranylgeranyl diphosphate synthase, type I
MTEPCPAPPPETGALASLGDDFDAVLAGVRPAVEARLIAFLSGKLERIGRYGADVAALVEATRDLTLRGGKRYRAALTAIAFGGIAPDAPIEPALQAGVALELLQTYLLIQDDWIDGDLTRRGGPSVHAALSRSLGERRGPAAAVLASDLTWGMALSVLAAIDVPAPRAIAAVQLLARVHEDVVIGQQIDMLGRAEDVDAMHDLKTGSYTVRGPIALGATLAGASAEALAALGRFAAPVGVAFQLRDDLLGTFGSPAETGKPVGNDLREGKRTAILVEAEPRLDAADRALLAKAFDRPGASEAEVHAAAEALDRSGARAAVVAKLARLCGEAEALAGSLPVTAAARGMLAGAAASLRVSP